MFVVMALVTTVATTPLTSALYPLSYQRKLEAWKRGEIDWDGNRLSSDAGSDVNDAAEKLQRTQIRRLLVYLRLDSLPSLFTFISLLGGDRSSVTTKIHRSKQHGSTFETVDTAGIPQKRPLQVHGLRILELTDRTSSVMKVSEEEYSYRDPVVNTFRTFAQLNNIAVSGGVTVVPGDSYAETLNNQAHDHQSDLVLIPWADPNTMAEDATNVDSSAGVQDAFILKALETATCDTAIFVNRGFGGSITPEPRTLTRTPTGLSLRSHREHVVAPVADRSHHVYFPFFGGSDDRVALRFVLQLAQNSNITVTIIHFMTARLSPSEVNKSPEIMTSPVGINESNDTGTTDSNTASDTALLHTLRDSLPEQLMNRVVFVDVPTKTPVSDCLSHAKQEISQSPKNAGDLIVVGRGKHSTITDMDIGHSTSGAEKRKTLGIVADALVSSGINGSVLVIQASGRSLA
jgi:nucleotide-binding universal stress UspA family protein